MADRLFLGIPLTEDASTELSRQLRKAFPQGLPGREIPPRNWHLTLRFVGDTSADAAARIRMELAAGALGRPFQVTFGTYGAFPEPRRARIVWAGVTEGSDAMIRLAEEVNARLLRAGVAAEDRPFSPHLTLARLRQPANLQRPLSAAAAPDVDLPVDGFALFRSHLGAGPPRYEIVEGFPLLLA